MCELLGAALLDGMVMSEESIRAGSIINNMLTIAIDPERLGTAQALAKEVRGYLDFVHAAPVRDGFDEVLTPGEPEQRARAARASGFEVDATTLGQLRDSAIRAGVPEVDASLG